MKQPRVLQSAESEEHEQRHDGGQVSVALVARERQNGRHVEHRENLEHGDPASQIGEVSDTGKGGHRQKEGGCQRLDITVVPERGKTRGVQVIPTDMWFALKNTN